MTYRFKHVAEYALLRGACGLLGRLPYRLALTLGWGIAVLLWASLPRPRREARRRIRSVLGASLGSEAEVRRVTWLAWRNLVFSGIDTMRLPHLTEAWVRQAIDCEGAEVLRAQLAASGKVVLAVPHMGSWEQAGVALCFFGLRLSLIMRRQKNPLTDAYLNRLRTSRGFDCIERDSKSLLRIALRHIKEGKVLTILPDVRSREPDLQVNFLGGTAAVTRGMALFAKMADAPILPGCVLREGWTRHRWQTFPPVYPDPAVERDADLQRMTQQVFDLFDRTVREHPDQYFWFNKRWILDPLTPAPAAPPAGGA
jgi:KDO2-lipid IV(A) lauroyltransferase